MTLNQMLRRQMRFWAKQWRILNAVDSQFAQVVLSLAIMRREESKKNLPSRGR